ncbi:hypothetical protein C819_04077 [Lachnospiraceae bacterium 10-1]|nr:hypothetical protein C819_04077 [Lachnospiraceae bacterium 10-1]
MGNLYSEHRQQQDSKNTANSGLHLPMIENQKFSDEQSQEIRLGTEEGLNVSLYAKAEFNWLQMEQIRMGLKDKVDVSTYADPAYSYDTMKQIRLAFYSSTDLSPYLNRGFADDELEQIRLALEDGLPIDRWITDDMYAQQIHEIRIGMYEDLNVAIYADVKYNWMQMQEIRLGLEKKLTVSDYANPLFNHWQMKEIRLGLEAGLDVFSYAKLIYTSSDMEEMRLNLSARKDSSPSSSNAPKPNAAYARAKEFSILIEDNGNKAYAFIPWVPGNAVTKEDILDDLALRGIVLGIKHDVISEMITKRRMNEKILIAEGTPAKAGKDGWYEFFVRLDLPRIPAPLPDGGVDYVNIEAFEMVEEGEKIAVYHRAEKGTDGKNVFGEVIHANNGLEKNPLKGVGFALASDGVTYFSKISGKFEFINGRIVITNMIVVCEDVTAVTGKLEVDGSVHVIGSIHSGGYIKASGDIIVEYNVETAKLIAGGNVMIKKGSCSKRDCFIEAGGEVSGSFFEAANITAGGNVKANYIMNSNIRTMGRVIVSGSKGILLGGSICAVKGVDTYNLGNSSHIKTLLDIGRNELYEQEQIKLNDRREIILNAISALEEGWNKMLKHLPAKKELAEETLKKLNATIVAKDRELANLDAEISKLANMTDQDMKAPVCVRGNAYPGSVIIINSIKYMLPSDVNRIIFKLRNKTVVMVKL